MDVSWNEVLLAKYELRYLLLEVVVYRRKTALKSVSAAMWVACTE